MNKMIKLISIALISTSLAGCALFSGSRPDPAPPVETVTQRIPQEIYQPPLPNPVRLEDIRWFVITADNLDAQIARIENLQDGDFVVFAVTPRDYENMAGNLQELRRYVRQQREIIEYYREATRGSDSMEEWLERNRQLTRELRDQPQED